MEQKHILHLTDFKKLELSGVTEVIGFDKTQIELSLGNTTLLIGGTELKIESFSHETGQISIEGNFDSLFREHERAKESHSLFSRIFS